MEKCYELQETPSLNINQLQQLKFILPSWALIKASWLHKLNLLFQNPEIKMCRPDNILHKFPKLGWLYAHFCNLCHQTKHQENKLHRQNIFCILWNKYWASVQQKQTSRYFNLLRNRVWDSQPSICSICIFLHQFRQHATLGRHNTLPGPKLSINTILCSFKGWLVHFTIFQILRWLHIWHF